MNPKSIRFKSQESIISARQHLEDAVAESFRSDQSSSLPAERPDRGGLRMGVAPGAFPSLLEHAMDPTGSRPLSEEVRIQQVALRALNSKGSSVDGLELLAFSDLGSAEGPLQMWY